MAEENDEPQIQIWGYDHTQDRIGIRPGLTTTKPIDIKQWIGGEEVLGYLDTDGFIHRHNDPTHSTSNAAKDRRKYQDVAISGTGLVLAALTSELRLAPRLPTNRPAQADTYTCKLELWPSFDSLLAECLKSSKTTCTTLDIPNLDSTLTEVKIAAGAGHFLILVHNREETDDDGYRSMLFSCGDNRLGQLGLGIHSAQVNTPQLIEGLENIKSIGCGAFHSLALSIDGTLYTWGSNRNGQCGQTASDLSFPTLVDIGGAGENGDVIDVVQACCGSEHTVALTSQGVWVTGSNSLGQLGLREEKVVEEFKLNKAVGEVMGSSSKPSEWLIKCGRWHTFVWD